LEQVEALLLPAALIMAGMSLSIQPSDAANTRILASILREIKSYELIQRFTDDDRDDDSLVTLSNLKPERIAAKYGLSLRQAADFVDRCRARAGISSSPSSSSSPAPLVLPESPVNDATIMNMLNFDVIEELGKGGFGTVYKCKNRADRLIVAVKIVSDPKNAKEAVREGQRLRRLTHKNIVLMHKVHDMGNGSCALEMEVVSGGDLYHHLEACRSRPNCRLPHEAVLRFTRQLLETLVYIHDVMKWLHGDIKPQNILIQCTPVPADGSSVNYSSAEIKLADFGLAKILNQQGLSQSLLLSANSVVGGIKGTEPYLSPEALQGASSGGYERTPADDLWSACLVIFEMDTGIRLQQLMTAPGAVRLEELLTKTSPELLPLLFSVLAVPDAASRCKSAAELLQKLDASMDPLYIWEQYDVASTNFVSVHPASSVALEEAFAANQPHTMLPLQPPLDLNFDIKALLTSATALGSATERRSGAKRAVRRLLKPSVLTSSSGIPIWQQLVGGKEWLQCSPAMCAKLELDSRNASVGLDASRFRRIMIESACIGSVQLPHAMRSEPYLAPAHANDITVLSKRVHESLSEWDISEAFQVVNPALASRYAAYRHRLAARCNGNPNERMLFHLAPDFVIPKIWQAGEGFETRLAQWAEVGKGAYFCENIFYNYAYKFDLWAPPDKFKVVAEPPVGTKMHVFAVLVCLGNVADMGPGCESCPSPAFLEWKKEYSYQKSAQNPNPLPTRPPATPLPSDAAERKHMLDLLQVKNEPRYDSVFSTEGDLATHPDSKCKTAEEIHMRDVIHPRLKAQAKEFGKQYVLFDSSSYPMFLLTVTKTGRSPVGPQQLMDAGCDANRVKALGFTASDVKALGQTVQEMRAVGWSLTELKEAGFDAVLLLNGGCSVSEIRSAGFTAVQLKDAGCDCRLLKDAGFSALQSRDAGFHLSDLDLAGYDFKELQPMFGYEELAQVHPFFQR